MCVVVLLERLHLDTKLGGLLKNCFGTIPNPDPESTESRVLRIYVHAIWFIRDARFFDTNLVQYFVLKFD